MSTKEEQQQAEALEADAQIVPDGETDQATDEQDQADFAAGFNELRGVESADDDAPLGDRIEQEQEPAVEAEPELPLEDQVRTLLDINAKLDKRLSKVEGRQGAMQDDMRRFQEARKASSSDGPNNPSARQVTAAIGQSPEFKVFQEEFPDLASAVVAELQAVAGSIGGGMNMQELRDELLPMLTPAITAVNSENFVESYHRGWKQTVQTPEFDGWLKSAPADVRELAQSDHPRDAIELLDHYQQFDGWLKSNKSIQRLPLAEQLARYDATALESSPQNGQTNRQDLARRRLAASVPATRSGSGNASRHVMTDEEEFEQTFRETRGH